MTDVSSPWVERMAPSHSTKPLIPDFVDNLPAPRLSKRHSLTIVMTITRQNQLLLPDSNKLLNDFFFCFVPFKVWRRRLVLRHKLTMHTAFAREDNSAPAAITSLLVSKWVLWFLWTDQSIDRENDRPNSRPNERSTDWTKTGTSDFSTDRRTNEWQKTNDKRRTVNKERSTMNNEQANERRKSGETYRPSNKQTKKRASERKNDRTNDLRMNERTNRRTTNGATDAFLKHLLTQPDIFSALVVVNDHVKDSATLLSELNTDRFPLFTGIIASYLLEISADGSTVGLWLTPQVWTDHADKYTHITLSRILHTKIHGIFRITIIV